MKLVLLKKLRLSQQMKENVCLPTPSPVAHNGNAASGKSSISSQMGAPLQPPPSHHGGLSIQSLHQLSASGMKGRSSPKLPPSTINLSSREAHMHGSHHGHHGSSRHDLHGMSSSRHQSAHQSSAQIPGSKVPSLLKGVCYPIIRLLFP